MKVLWIFAILLLSIHYISCDLLVKTTGGDVRGKKIYPDPSSSYYYEAFMGIPYAKPPLGNLRFRAPVKHQGWNGVYDATAIGSGCVSVGLYGLGIGGKEDCLFINVYRPSRPGKYAVYFWIPGGGFAASEDEMFNLTPEYQIKENLIFVSVNYRLGAFGFLSTEDKYAQGNYGLKDIVLSLEWVQENIENFGGDKRRVTLVGNSVGAIASHYLMMTDIPKKLFSQAIMTSGSALIPVVFQYKPLRMTKLLAQALNITYDSTKDLVKKLRATSTDALFNAQIAINTPPLWSRSLDWAPTIEPHDSCDKRLIKKSPEWNMANGKFRNIPVMIGTASHEGLFPASELILIPPMIEHYNQNLNLFVPPSYDLDSDSEEVVKVTNMLRQKYLNGRNLISSEIENFAKLEGDLIFKWPAYRTVKYFANEFEDSSIYYYEFSYEGSYAMGKTLFQMNNYAGVCHCDDLPYMFETPYHNFTGPSDYGITVKNQVSRMHAYFVKYGNPTPCYDDLIKIKWPKYESRYKYYMQIGSTLKVKKGGFPTFKPLQELQEKYTGHF